MAIDGDHLERILFKTIFTMTPEWSEVA